jgi:hypothetical protein
VELPLVVRRAAHMEVLLILVVHLAFVLPFVVGVLAGV